MEDEEILSSLSFESLELAATDRRVIRFESSGKSSSSGKSLQEYFHDLPYRVITSISSGIKTKEDNLAWLAILGGVFIFFGIFGLTITKLSFISILGGILIVILSLYAGNKTIKSDLAFEGKSIPDGDDWKISMEKLTSNHKKLPEFVKTVRENIPRKKETVVESE